MSAQTVVKLYPGSKVWHATIRQPNSEYSFPTRFSVAMSLDDVKAEIARQTPEIAIRLEQ